MSTGLARLSMWPAMVAIVITLLLAVVGRVEVSTAQQEPVKVGLATYMEGPALRWGRSSIQGFETAVEYINERGGILGGRKVVGVVTSQGLTGETAKAAALRLTQRDKVKILFGPQWAETAPAGFSVAKRFNLPFAPMQGGMWLYEQGQPGILGLTATARSRAMPQMRTAEKKGYKNIVLVFADIPYNHDVQALVKERWERSDSRVKVLDLMWYQWGQADVKKEMIKAIGQNPDAIWSENWSPAVTVSMMKALRELNYKGDFYVSGLLTKDILREVPKEISEGTYSVATDYWPSIDTSENKAFVQYWRKRYGPDADPHAGEEASWAQTVFMLLALDKAGTTGDGTKAGLLKIHKAMLDLRWQSPKGEVRLTKEGLGMFRSRPFMQVQNGEVKILEMVPLTPNDWLPGQPHDWSQLK